MRVLATAFFWIKIGRKKNRHKYLKLLSTGIGMNQSGGLYGVTLGVGWSSCHKSPGHRHSRREQKSVTLAAMTQMGGWIGRMLYPCGLLVWRAWCILNRSPSQCPSAAEPSHQAEWSPLGKVPEFGKFVHSLRLVDTNTPTCTLLLMWITELGQLIIMLCICMSCILLLWWRWPDFVLTNQKYSPIYPTARHQNYIKDHTAECCQIESLTVVVDSLKRLKPFDLQGQWLFTYFLVHLFQ